MKLQTEPGAPTAAAPSDPARTRIGGRMPTLLSTAGKIGVSAAVLALLLWRIPPADVLRAATATGVFGYGAVAAGLVVFLLLGTLRVHLTVNAFASVPFSAVLLMYLRSVALGAFTPGQLGELSLAYFLARRGIDAAASLAITAVDRLTTLATLVALAGAGILLYLPHAGGWWLWSLIGSLTAALALLYVRGWRHAVRRRVEGVMPTAIPFFEAFCRFFLVFPGRAAANVLLGLARWVCAAFMILVIIEPQVPTPVDRGFVLVANAAARLATYLPISINGLGVLELSAVELFAQGGIDPSLTLAAFIVNRVVYYAFAAVMVVTLAWSRRDAGGSAHV